jgi:membrane-bound lytic murein transglycosylase D
MPNMKLRAAIGFAVAMGMLSLAGCEQTATKQVRVGPPAATPNPSLNPNPAPNYAHVSLPLPANPPTSGIALYNRRPAIEILVEQVQKSVDQGQKDYDAGDVAKAQADFDAAINQILRSGFERNADPRLLKLFDQIGEAEHSDELNASEGEEPEEEAAQAPATPAPIDEIADLTLPAGDSRLVAKAQREMISVRHDLPLTVNDSVLQYLSFFTTTRGRAIVSRGLEREGRYDVMIRRALREEGVPEDLIYLAQAESAFQPQAVSKAGARGIWQFMPYRGEEYELERTNWVDERSDPEKATRAAARHLRDLYGMFGDWYLVMAAYNSGPLSVARAIERTGYADFWELQKRNALPRETKNYVPIILALALVAKAPTLYGLQVTPEKPTPADTVILNHSIDLHLAADAAGADLDDIRMLNPALIRNVTPNDAGFHLLLPAGSANPFNENIQQVPVEKWTSWRLHATDQGETLSDVAKHYRVTVPAMEAANHLEPHAIVPAGFLLNVPTAPPAVRLVRYRVQRGDTLEGIADRFDVTVAQLRRWNHISGVHVPRGARLRIYAGSGESPSVPPARGKSAQTSGASLQSVSSHDPSIAESREYRVKAGETLYSIARTHQTTVSALRQANPFLADRSLQAGDVLTMQR